MHTYICIIIMTWWRHQMEKFSALLAICAGTGEFPQQRPVTRSFDVLFHLRLNQRLTKQLWSWWFETLSCPLWRHSNESRSTYGFIVNGNIDGGHLCDLIISTSYNLHLSIKCRDKPITYLYWSLCVFSILSKSSEQSKITCLGGNPKVCRMVCGKFTLLR